MPFIGTQRLKNIEEGLQSIEILGDICALAYKPMVEKWLANPSWTTWSIIRLEVGNRTWTRNNLSFHGYKLREFSEEEIQNQVEAAAEVFYSLYILPYEIKKRKENGGVIDENN